ncbi:MAG: VCBS repeat-containing protein [Candidatus Binatia bacterium]
MFPLHLKNSLRLTVAAGALVLALAPSALAIEVQCGLSGNGDAFGWAVASGGDYDGDGTDDIAVGAPCAWVGSKDKAGRVKIYSGATGRVLVSLKGGEALERYGAALAFVPDLNADGKDELAIGAYTFDAPKDGGGVRVSAGRVEVRSAKLGGTVLWEVQGATEIANLGESLDWIPDVNGDGKAEVVIGASEAMVGGSRDGIAYLFSGADGSLLGQNDGQHKGENWASVVGYAGDMNGDGVADWLAASNQLSLPAEEVPDLEGDIVDTTTTTTTTTTVTTLVDRVGKLSVLSGQAPYDVLVDIVGNQRGQRLGRSAAAGSDGNGDGKSDLWVGSPGANSGNQAEAGAIDLFSVSGQKVRRILEPAPQAFAAFGTSVITPGSLDGGADLDVVAGAPLARVGTMTTAGRVHAFNGAAAGPALWSAEGSQTGTRLGHSLAGSLDFDGDGVVDVVAGAPGSSPNGRRGAGAAYVLSGEDGSVLATLAGRRGRETRIFVAGPDLSRQSVVRSFDPFGRRREAELRPFRSGTARNLSMAFLDVGGRGAAANTLIAVGAGKGSGTPQVAVYRAARRRHRVSLFDAAPDGYSGGVNVASGSFSVEPGHNGDELVSAPADAVAGGTINVKVHRRDTDGFGRISWIKVREFAAFKSTDMIEGSLVHAVGVNVAAANLRRETGTPDPPQMAELVVAPSAGLPVVRVLTSTGTTISQWQAYPVLGPSVGVNSGTSIAIADLKGNGNLQILTAPAAGYLRVRAWNLDSSPYRLNPQDNAVDFFVPQFPAQFEGGLTIAAADVDLDGADEILVAPGPGIAGRVLAYEANGTLVAGWPTNFQPFGPLATGGLTLAGMNDFWRP